MTQPAHPHSEWTRERLESYIGTPETLTLEFKSYRALLPGEKSKAKVVAEAAKDVAAMANEQKGEIVYGIESGSHGSRRLADRLEGFRPTDGIDKDWLLSILRSHINPPLPDLDVAEVDLGEDRFALVVLVPQAVGAARQTTDDMLFWRRGGEGVHKMTWQEIEDVSSRGGRPQLEVRAILQRASEFNQAPYTHRLRIRLEIHNPSDTTSSFAVATVGFPNASVRAERGDVLWAPVDLDPYWQVFRCSAASGSWSGWSPFTPGFTALLNAFIVDARIGEDRRPIFIGFARLDHEGGAEFYRLEYQLGIALDSELQQQPAITIEMSRQLLKGMEVPHLFVPGIDTRRRAMKPFRTQALGNS